MPRKSSRRSPRLPDDPKQFFRAALQRFAEARFVFEGERYTAAIYLAGYSVGCGLKSLILKTAPKNEQRDMADSFRGKVWHDLKHLVEYVNDEWSVDLRYLAGERPFREAERFVDSTDLILDWIKGRL